MNRDLELTLGEIHYANGSQFIEFIIPLRYISRGPVLAYHDKNGKAKSNYSKPAYYCSISYVNGETKVDKISTSMLKKILEIT